MGKVTELIEKIKDMNDIKLFNRFKHLVRAQAVREYLATKEDLNLKIEVDLIGDEIKFRMAERNKIVFPA